MRIFSRRSIVPAAHLCIWSSAGICCKVESPLALCTETKKILLKQGVFPNLISQNIFKPHWSSLHSFLNLIGTIKFVRRRRIHNNASVDIEISSKYLQVNQSAFEWDVLVKEYGLHNAKSLLSHQVLPEESEIFKKLRKLQHHFLLGYCFFIFAEVNAFWCCNKIRFAFHKSKSLLYFVIAVTPWRDSE